MANGAVSQLLNQKIDFIVMNLKEYKRLSREFHDFMVECNAIPTKGYEWRVSTVFGLLDISLHDNYVVSRFFDTPNENHPKFSILPVADELNKFSGKWNCPVLKNGRLDLEASINEFKYRLKTIIIFLGD